MFARFSSTKCKTQCKLCVGRIKLMRNKKQIMVKNMRKEVADLLRTNKQENARIRVEAVIRENLLLQAYEVLELFLELLAVRVQLVEKSKDVPPDMIEALSSLVYAASRVQDFQELVVIRAQLAGKFGKEFAAESSSDLTCRKWHVNENLIRCLSIEAPAPEDKLATLSDIAQEYGVEWDAHKAASDMLPSGPPPGTPPPPSIPPGNPSGAWGAGAGGGYPSNGPSGGQSALNRFPDIPVGAPRVLPGSLAAGKALPGDVQALAKGEWADAMAAATAAAEHARLAQEASNAAERFARAGTSQQANGVAPHEEAAPKPDTSATQDSTPDDLDIAAPPPPSTDDAPQALGFYKRSDSAIQRAYDAAPGPPSKKDAQAHGPPSAPPAPPTTLPPGIPSPPSGGPTVPSGSQQPGPAKPSAPSSGIDADLQKRFEALKRS
ncbi:probable IST1 homolog at N-terminal half [Coccomyxa sp. Obi]|nr:probable IST1 homolog at N-terminal half [Coccomyxa sp. Obi]